MSFCDIVINSLVGLVSGVISGLVVYWLTKRREHKYQIYFYWHNYLWGLMNEFELYFPKEKIDNAKRLKGASKEWEEVITYILHSQNKFGYENKEYTEEESELFEKVLIAIGELEKWKKKNRLK